MKKILSALAIVVVMVACGGTKINEEDFDYEYEEGATVLVMYKFMGIITGRKEGKYLVSYGTDYGMKEEFLDERVLSGKRKKEKIPDEVLSAFGEK